VTVEASLLSLIFIIIIFILIGVRLTLLHPIVQFDRMFRRGTYNVIGRPFRKMTGSCWRCPLTFSWSVLCPSISLLNLMLVARQFSIFICDFLQALGGLLNIRWVHNGIVKSGSYCTAQGVILQGTELAAALITLVCLFLTVFGFKNSRIVPDACYPHIRHGSMVSRSPISGIWFQSSWRHLHFLCSVGWHR
jgi:hypothetical protein